jgi:hypothetical protein
MLSRTYREEHAMGEKPSYLGLLNAIAVTEARAGRAYARWAEVTNDPRVRELVRFVAVREAEHGFTFEKRVMELGFTLRDRPDPDYDARLSVLGDPAMTDVEKLAHLGYADGGDVVDGPDPFLAFFNDRTIDIETGALLGRYICEERDTIRRMNACWKLLNGERSAKRPRRKSAA